MGLGVFPVGLSLGVAGESGVPKLDTQSFAPKPKCPVSNHLDLSSDHQSFVNPCNT